MGKCMLHKQTVPDPDLKIRRGGGGGGGGAVSFGPQFSLNIGGGQASRAPPLLDPPLTKHIGE